LTPNVDTENNSVTIPLLLKNAGNQNEVVLHAELLLEVNEIDSIFYKRISPYDNGNFLTILSPGDYKIIDLIGNYKEYLFGTIEILSAEEFEYHPIKVFNDLTLKLNISYLTANGIVANEEREVGRISFNQKDEIALIDCNPISIKKLNSKKNDFIIERFIIFPNHEIRFDSISVDLNDSSSIEENLDKIQLMNRLIELSREEK
jgi:hypothetical protein